MTDWRLYLDNCCFNRPYDEQSNLSVYLETQAKLYIQEQIRNGRIQLTWSFMLTAENEANPDLDIRDKIADWVAFSGRYIPYSHEIKNIANGLSLQNGVDAKDALHIACAVKAGCNYFLTTDKKLIRKTKQIDAMVVLNPIHFIELYLETEPQ